MASNVTLGAIILASKQRADMEPGTFISDPEWTNMTNASLSALYDKLLVAYGSDYFVQTPFEFTTDGTTERYPLPADFYKLMGVDLRLATGAQGWVSIWRFNFSDRNRFSLPNLRTIWGRGNLRYRLAANTLWLTPLAASGQQLRLWYAPAFVPLVLPSETFNGVNGWEEWVINDVAAKARVKEESAIDDLLKLQAIVEDRLRGVVDNRDIGQPQTTVDVYAANGGWGTSPDDWWL